MSRLTVQPVGSVSRDEQVRDYDQLDPIVKQFLAEFADDGTAIPVPPRVARCFDKYTDYLRIEA